MDDKIPGLYAGGMSVRDIAHHLSELYATEIARDNLSRITHSVVEDVAAWRSRPVEGVYSIVDFDPMWQGPRRPLGPRPCLLLRLRRHL